MSGGRYSPDRSSRSHCTTSTPSSAPPPASTSISRRQLGRSSGSRVPAPKPSASGRYSAGGGAPRVSACRIAAPVGVVHSPSNSGSRTGIPRSSLSTAGGGTGKCPWAMSTHPRPSATGRVWNRVAPSSWIPAIAASTSTMASSAPTSWKWTRSTVVPCTAASDSARSVNASVARSRTSGATPVPSMMRTTWCRCRCACSCGSSSRSRVQAIPFRSTRSASTRMSPSPSEATNPCSHSSGSPRSRSAATVMSPEMPAKGSKISAFNGGAKVRKCVSGGRGGGR